MTCPPAERIDADATASSPGSLVDIDSRTLTLRAVLPPGKRDPLALVPPSVATTHLVQAVAGWEDVTLAPHEQSAVVFERAGKEVGHIRPDGFLAVPLPASIREALLTIPTSILLSSDDAGAVTLQMDTADDVQCGAFLLRLSYTYRSVVACKTSRELAALQVDVATLELSGPLQDLYDDALARRAATLG
ncbi:MAG TPA: luciferase family protein [Longibacter sp.]